MRNAREGGWSLLEMIFVLAIFTGLLVMVTEIYLDLVRADRNIRAEMMQHPDVSVLIERFGRDVLDSDGFPASAKEWSRTNRVLLLRMGAGSIVVWDFSEKGMAKRVELDKGTQASVWTAREVPQFTVIDHVVAEGRGGLRLLGRVEGGDLIYDRIFQPRPR